MEKLYLQLILSAVIFIFIIVIVLYYKVDKLQVENDTYDVDDYDTE